MWSADYLLGGEDGGNIIFNDGYHTAADAIFTALTLIAVLVDTGTGLKSLAGNLVKRPQILRSFAVPLDAEFYTKMNDKLQHYEAELGPGGRILVWAASTEPGVTRLLVEGGAATVRRS